MLLIGGKDESAETIKNSIWKFNSQGEYFWVQIGNLQQVTFAPKKTLTPLCNQSPYGLNPLSSLPSKTTIF